MKSLLLQAGETIAEQAQKVADPLPPSLTFHCTACWACASEAANRVTAAAWKIFFMS